MINVIISVKGIQNISDRLYIIVCTFNNFFINIQQVPDQWRDACKLLEFDSIWCTKF